MRNLSKEQALSLIITSIAKEEISLSNLLDAEAKKITECIKWANPQEILEINNSVDNTIRDITKLQMLLQIKLDLVHKMLPSMPITPKKEQKITYYIPNEYKGCKSIDKKNHEDYQCFSFACMPLDSKDNRYCCNKCYFESHPF